MTTLRISIKMDNAAFGEDPEVEVNRILEEVKGFYWNHGVQDMALRDINGNPVGAARVIKDDEEVKG